MIKRHIFEILDVLKFAGIILLVFMFIHFNTSVANQAQETKDIAASTNSVVKSQGDILKAIKQVTDDTHITAAQQTAIIICMLQVPVESRTTDLQAQCRSQSTSVAPSTTSVAVPVASQQPSKVEASSSQPQSAPNPNKTQADKPASNPTPPTTLDKVPVVGVIFKTLGL